MDRRAFLHMSACISAGIVAGSGLTLAVLPKEAFARGPAAAESAKAKQIFDQLGVSEKGNRRGPQNNVFTLAPGEYLIFESEGYCLDGNLAVPSDEEPMAFRPMKAYIAPALRNLYMALMRNAAKGEAKDINMQQLVFNIRSEASTSESSIIDSADYAFVNQLVPGGEQLLKTAHRPDEYTFDFGLSFWASQDMPDTSKSYSMLTQDGVAGRGLGLGGLSMRGIVANGSAKPFVFDPVLWVLEPSRDVQAVAVPMPKLSFVAKGKMVDEKRTEPGPSAKDPAPSTKDPGPAPSAQSKKKSGEDNEFAGH